MTKHDAFAMLEMGNSLFFQNQLDEAERCYRQAIQMHPNYPQAFTNLGSILQEKGFLQEAIDCHQHAVQLDPNWVDALYNLGNASKELGDNELAIQCYEKAIALRPGFAQAHLNLGLALLLEGKLSDGWSHYEWRFSCNQPPQRAFQVPKWIGDIHPGKTLLVHAEQGFGDILMFARYLRLAKQISQAQVLLECPKTLIPILQSVAGVDQFLALGEPLPWFDFHIPLLSLPHVFQTNLNTIPSSPSYLTPDHERMEHWRTRFDSKTKMKIGIVWQGDPTYRWDHLRSLPLRLFESIGRLPNVQLFSLQKGYGTEQINDPNLGFPIDDLGGRLDESGGAFMDTAAVMTHMDLVIAPDTAVAHLAGAMGVPTWLLLPTIPHWVWMLDRDDTPWYPSMRLFRQSAKQDWRCVIDRVAEQVRMLNA